MMAYFLTCNRCKETTKAWEIVDLITEHTHDDGMLKCTKCDGEAHVYQVSQTQDGGKWERYIRAVIAFKTQFGDAYVPYVFLLSYTPNGKLQDVHFNYYKDLRASGGRLKHGHGPGGAPVFGKGGILRLLEHLAEHGILSPSELTALAGKVERKTRKPRRTGD